MIRKHASLMIAMLLVGFVATACIVRTRQPRQSSQPVYVNEGKPEKHKEHKDDHGKHKGHDRD